MSVLRRLVEPKQYASDDYIAALEARGITRSMSRKGDCYDNAVAESFFGILKNELVHTTQFENMIDARSELFRYIEGFYNRRRLHSYLGYLSPDQFEYDRQAA